MNRLMRAEWYRIWHSGNIRVYVVLAALLFAVFPVFGSLGMMKEPLITHIRDDAVSDFDAGFSYGGFGGRNLI